MTIGCAVMALKIYVLIVLDCITFLTFFVAIDGVILSALLLSAGVSMGDFFSNSALAHQGEIGMATLACFANQNFNLLLGLTASVYVNLKLGVVDFDLFGIYMVGTRLLMRHWFMTVLIAFCLINIAFHWLHYRRNNFHLEKWFAKLLVLEYLAFLFVAVFFAAISHWLEF
jgi:Ca2+/Na+ antiporter